MEEVNGDCGTQSGYQAHGRRGEPRCEPCKKAHREYVAAWRRAYPRTQQHESEKQLARNRALRRLARLHPGEFRTLYDEELATLPDPFPATTAALSEVAS